MNPEDDANNWQDHAGDSPDMSCGWTWDMRSLEVGEYVGFKLYQALRARVVACHVPVHACNRVILHMIDMHDAELIDTGVGCATLVTSDPGDTTVSFVKIVEADQVAPFVTVTNWKHMLDDKLNLKCGDFDHLLDDTDDPADKQQPDRELPDQEPDDTIE